jgi:signal transduction histidine kinase
MLRLQAARLQIAAEVARVVTSMLDIEQVLPRVTDLLRERFGYYHVGVSLIDETGEWIILRASSSETVGHELEGVLKFRVGKEGMMGFVAGTGTPRVAQDVTADRAYLAHPLFPDTRAEAVLPLKIGDTVFGVLDVESKVVNAFPPDAVSILTTIADQIAVAIQNARLHNAEKQRAQELEQAYRTLQANQAQLLISEKMASLGRLTAGIAHEMNTPLAAVRAALVEMEKLVNEYQTSIGDADVTPDDHRGIAQEMQQALRLAGGAAERAASFVRGIKTQTRDLAAHDSQRFNAVPVIRETLLLLGHTLRAGKCKADFEPAVEKVELDGSPGRLAQVITNLVTNAADACAAKGGGSITVRVTPRAHEVELQVRDTGSGIPPEIIPKIFDPMFTTKPFGQGTGLGLAIVHDIVTGEFGGTIQVTSQIDQATTFILRFPKLKEG